MAIRDARDPLVSFSPVRFLRFDKEGTDPHDPVDDRSANLNALACQDDNLWCEGSRCWQRTLIYEAQDFLDHPAVCCQIALPAGQGRV